VSRYQKGKTNLDPTGARDSERQRHQLGHTLETDNHARGIASTPPLSLHRPDAPPAAQPTAPKLCRKAKYSSKIHKNEYPDSQGYKE